ncbi:hypothetical protein [Mangrovimonas sp. YM274]|uniref:hypothetical protein n=1 Tax=Mangrovimonas sp. YM274 TaxID=3070660 RepID=UPI0027DD8EBC|nr:hypothetical protein [Mangrovimonas sp. YM274]WMI70053.1 hypothetical protein RBH95_06815 [Mangrovimonas sp. YM274]
MKFGILIVIFLVSISCKNATENNSDKIKTNRFELLPYPDKEEQEKYLKNLNLTTFLENPIDLQEFKNKTKRDVTTSVTNGLEYYFQPKINDSIFYSYNFISTVNRQLEINEIVVFKYGKNQHNYEDKTEILIELKINNKDSDLGKANLIGLSKTELESEFGTDYLTFKNGIAYSNKNKVLILEIDSSIVKSYRYIKLNTEKIDDGLIEQIIK